MLRHNLAMTKLLVIHGPNLHLLGKRQTGIYGNWSLNALDKAIAEKGASLGFQVTCMQSNSESKIIDIISSSQDKVDYLVFNPAAFTHTSIAIYDTLLATAVKFIEVHISNVDNREDFRNKSYFSPIAIGTITGFGPNSYLLALDAIKMQLQLDLITQG